MKSFRDLRRGAFRGWNRYQLEQETSRALQLMEGHKKAGLPPGHHFYKALRADVNKAINAYCAQYQIPYDSVVVGIPQMRELEGLADGTVARMPTAVYPVAVFVLGIIGTIYLAGCRDLYVYLSHFVR